MGAPSPRQPLPCPEHLLFIFSIESAPGSSPAAWRAKGPCLGAPWGELALLPSARRSTGDVQHFSICSRLPRPCPRIWPAAAFPLPLCGHENTFEHSAEIWVKERKAHQAGPPRSAEQMPGVLKLFLGFSLDLAFPAKTAKTAPGCAPRTPPGRLAGGCSSDSHRLVLRGSRCAPARGPVRHHPEGGPSPRVVQEPCGLWSAGLFFQESLKRPIEAGAPGALASDRKRLPAPLLHVGAYK